MKFMKTEGESDIGLQEGKLTETEAEAWKKEYLSAEGKEPPEKVSKKWVDDYTASGSGSEYFSGNL